MHCSMCSEVHWYLYGQAHCGHAQGATMTCAGATLSVHMSSAANHVTLTPLLESHYPARLATCVLTSKLTLILDTNTNNVTDLDIRRVGNCDHSGRQLPCSALLMLTLTLKLIDT